MGIGATDDWNGVARFVRRGRLVEPDAVNQARYDEAYALYRATYEALRPLFARCATLAGS